jgi:hypothetical protein
MWQPCSGRQSNLAAMRSPPPNQATAALSGKIFFQFLLNNFSFADIGNTIFKCEPLNQFEILTFYKTHNPKRLSKIFQLPQLLHQSILPSLFKIEATANLSKFLL